MVTKRTGRAAVFASILAGAAIILAGAAIVLAAIGSPAAAQIAPELRNPNVTADYYEPRSRALLPLYQTLQKRQVLEELGAFLAPVKWTRKLRLIAKECPPSTGARPDVFFNKFEYSLTICYQWLATLRKLRPPPAFASKQQVIVGGLVGIVLHESARAMFDMLGVPVLGSEDDAADQVSAYIGLQFGDLVATTVIKGTYYVWKTFDPETTDPRQRDDFSTRASAPRQRMYNVLCIGYGGAPALFKNFVDQGDLLHDRAENCAEEYRQVDQAFQKVIVPRVNTDLMKISRSVTWLSEEDLK